MKTYLTYDDVNIIPKYSELKSRDKVDLTTRFTKNTILTIPIVASPMDTVTELDMAKEMMALGGVGVIHRFMSIKEQSDIVKKLNLNKKLWGQFISENVTLENEVDSMFAYAGTIIGSRLGLSDHIEQNSKTFSLQLQNDDFEKIKSVTSKANDLFESIGDCGGEYR